MKKFYLIGGALLFLSSIIFPQTITFEKINYTYEPFFVSAFQLDNGDFLFANPGALIRTDDRGNIQWKKTIEESANNNAIQTAVGDNQILIPGSKPNNNFKNLMISLFDFNGNLVNQKTIDNSANNEIGYAAQFLNGNYYVLSHIENDSIKVYEFDSSLNLLWSKAYEFIYYSFSKRIGIIPNENSLIIFGNKSVVQIDTSGTLQNNFTLSDKITDAELVNSNLFLSLGSTIEEIDLDGNSLNSFAPGFNPTGIFVDPDNNIIAVGTATIAKLNSAGNIIWQNTHRSRSTFSSIIQCGDNGFLAIGGIASTYGCWRLKVDETGNYSFIDIDELFTYDGISREYNLTWETNVTSDIQIDFSKDNGGSWTKIAELTAGTFSYEGIFPLEKQDSCKLKVSLIADPEVYDETPPFQISVAQNYDYIAANEVLMWIGNNGDGSHDPRTDGSGFYWPGGESATLPSIFEDGLVWGGKIDGEVRLNGCTHRQGLQPGIIMENGLPSDPKDSKYKIFKLKNGWESLPDGPEKERLQYDYENWPMDIGAPYNDIDNNGAFTPGIDTPRLIGDETLFSVSNDLDSATSQHTYGSDPIGLEIQTTVWAYNSTESPIKDAVFKLYKIINKSDKQFEDVYFTYWTDDDLGNAVDDYVGCEPLLNLGYSYNSDNDDEDFYGSPPPAVGHMFVHTPVVEAAENDSAYFNGSWQTGYKNLPINSFVLYIGGSPIYYDPTQGSYEGTLEFYNNQLGLTGDGQPFHNPLTGKDQTILLDGDPAEGTGWYEGDGWQGGPTPGDRRYVMTTGKFNMAPGDKQEIAIAIFMAQGSDNLNSVTKLKEAAIDLQYFYNGKVLTDVRENEIQPLKYSLSQNYPNPFNPSTKIKFSIANDDRVNISIFNILGERVAVLTDQVYKAGSHEIQFNASQLSSGVYFYQMQSGDFVNVKKLMLLK